MSIFHFIFLPLLLYALKNHHRAFLLYVIMRLFLDPLVPFLYMGSQRLQMMLFMDTCMFAIVFLNYINNMAKTTNSISTRFPLKKPFLICIFSILISSLIFSPVPLSQTLASTYDHISQFIFVYLFWRELKKITDVRFIVKGLMIVFSIAIVYAFFERFSDFYNPLHEYKVSLNPSDFEGWVGGGTQEAIRGRTSSIFHSSLGCGAYAAIVAAFFFYINISYKKVWNSTKLTKLVFMIGLFFLLLFANGRGAMLYFAISMLFMLKLKRILSLSLFLPVFFIIFYDILAPSLATVLSIYSQNESEVQGSSWAMRVIQFFATVDVLKGSPWFGYGEKGVMYIQSLRPEVLGMESMWLQIMAKRGIFGVVSFIYLYYSMFKLGKGMSKRYVVASVVAWLVLSTTTVGGDLHFQICLILIAYRLECEEGFYVR
jgi:O-antigen ligase